MNKEEILDGNKLIAEFMGLSYCTKYTYEGWYKNSEYNNRICDFDGLKYNTLWDWLMPVVEKIESLSVLYSVEIIRKTCVVRVDSNTIFSMYYKEDRNKIKSTWLAVVEFIKWYNKNKQ